MSAPTIVWIRDGVGFTPPAAASFRRLEADLGRQVDVNSTFRDPATQDAMYRAWQDYVNGRGPYPGHSRALPASESVHCQGEALDSDDWVTPGFIALAAEHGWIRTAAWDPTEQHHFEYQADRDQHRADPTPDQEEDMFTDEDRANLEFVKQQLGGSSTRRTSLRQDVDGLANAVAAIAKTVASIKDIASWIKTRIGGSILGKAKSITDLLRG